MTLDASVIIPTTGARNAFLRRALQSVRAQHPGPAEVLVVVDGDERLRARVATEIDAFWVTVLATGARRGASAARNVGAAVARSNHLCFLDDDDVWKPGYLAAVFASPAPFDLALTAFEKHTREGARPEKVPPEVLDEAHFRIANSGLRGSNLVITRAALAAAGGFDEGLVSFNDMDLGIRLARLPPLRYRRIKAPLVEYHAHDGERLSRRGAVSVEPGMLAFLDRHEPSMSVRERVAFRNRAVGLWGVDPWTLDRLHARALRAERDGEIHRRFAGLLLGLETALLEATAEGDAKVDEVQGAIDRLCRAWERSRTEDSRLELLRLAVISTDAPGAPERLVTSLLREINRVGWRPAARAGHPWVELLLLENHTDLFHSSQDNGADGSFADPRVRVVRHAIGDGLPLPTSRARAAAFEVVRSLGWRPSPRAPVWFLDEDFRFEVLLPSRARGHRLAPGGSLLHRLEEIVRAAVASGAAAIVGGNSMAPPVPAAGLLRRQLADLWCPPTSPNVAWANAEAVRARLARPDPYYDLTTDIAEARPSAWRAAWWREDGCWDWDEVYERLTRGLPVSRASLPPLVHDAGAAWGSMAPPSVSGGNTILVDEAGLRPDLFATREHAGIVSRRGDSVWCSRLQREGVRVVCAALPLAHDRVARRGDAAMVAARDALADALGVGTQRAFLASEAPAAGEIARLAEVRRETLITGLRAASAAIRGEAPPPDMPPSFPSRMASFIEDLVDGIDGRHFAETVS